MILLSFLITVIIDIFVTVIIYKLYLKFYNKKGEVDMLLNIKISSDFKKEIHLVSESRGDKNVFIIKYYNKGVLENEVLYSNMDDAVEDYRNIIIDGDSHEE